MLAPVHQSGLTADFGHMTQKKWERLMARAGRSALQQDWNYANAVLEQGHKVFHCRIAEKGKAIGFSLLVQRSFLAGFKIAMCLRGPVWLENARPELEPWLIGEWTRYLPSTLVLWSPEENTVNDQKIRAGCRKVLTGYTTIWLDLSQSVNELHAGLHQKWRNLLRKSEKQPIAVRKVISPFLIRWLIDTNEAYRKKVGYRGPSVDFIRSLGRNQTQRLVLIAQDERDPIAGIIIQIHGKSATYYVGVTTDKGRVTCAHHRLLWQAVIELKQMGILWFDLGGIDTHKAPGIARFKLGMGGSVQELPGTYLVMPHALRKTMPGSS